MQRENLSPCGINCSDCEWYKGEMEPKCPSCVAVEGKPFWGTCLTYSCTKDHGVEHCGLCEEFPCTDYMTRYDPSKGPANALMRAGLLAYRAKFGDDAALELLEKAENYKPPE